MFPFNETVSWLSEVSRTKGLRGSRNVYTRKGQQSPLVFLCSLWSMLPEQKRQPKQLQEMEKPWKERVWRNQKQRLCEWLRLTWFSGSRCRFPSDLRFKLQLPYQCLTQLLEMCEGRFVVDKKVPVGRNWIITCRWYLFRGATVWNRPNFMWFVLIRFASTVVWTNKGEKRL